MISVCILNTLFSVKNGIQISNPISTDILKVLKEPFNINKRGIDVNSIYSDPEGIPDSRISDFGNITLYAKERHGIEYERTQFQLVLVFLSIFSCMVLTNWGRTNGAPISYGNNDAALISFWIKITVLWVFFLFELRYLQAKSHYALFTRTKKNSKIYQSKV